MRLFVPFALSLFAIGPATHAEVKRFREFKPQFTPPALNFMASVKTDEEVAREFLDTRLNPTSNSLSPFASIPPADNSLKTKSSAKTQTSVHIAFQQYHEQIPILEQEIKVHLDMQQKPVLLNGLHTDLQGLQIQNDLQLTLQEAILKGREATAPQGLHRPSKAFKAWIPHGGELILGYAVTVYASEPLGEWVHYIHGQSGEVLKRFNQSTSHPKIGHSSHSHAHFKAGESKDPLGLLQPIEQRPAPASAAADFSRTASAKVHIPSYTLDPSRKEVTLRHLDPSGTLSGSFANVFSAHADRARAREGTFFFPRHENGYLEAMAYFHIQEFQHHLQDLGFEYGQSATEVVVNYSAADNSFFSPDTKGVYFGAGGQPDAADADIIVHEYAHAIIDEAAGLYGGYGTQTAAIHEGLADYFAASLFQSPQIGEHDSQGVSPTGYLRTLQNSYLYPDDYREDSHFDGQILSGALWELQQRLGAQKTDILVLAALPFLPASAQFADLGQAIVAADELRFGGRHKARILRILRQRGLMGTSTENARKSRFEALHQ